MRPHMLTSAVFSFARLGTSSTIAATTTTSAITTSSLATYKTSHLALKTLASTCPQRSLFTYSASQCRPFKPQAKTTTSSNQNPIASSPSASYSTKMAAPIKADSLLELIKARRSHYALNKDLVISKERIQEIVKEAIFQVPSSFNSQSNRVLILFGADHDKLWGFATDILKTIVPEDAWEHTATRMNLFKSAAGTVLFFEDQDVVNNMQAQFPLYSDKFPIWASQSDAMLQFVVWTALSAEGLGANLQHYNPLIDNKVASEWGIPDSWKLNAQLVFGGRTGEASPKDQKPIEERLKVSGA